MNKLKNLPQPLLRMSFASREQTNKATASAFRLFKKKQEVRKMKAIGFVSGIALGMAAAVAAVSAVYPDIPKRAKRDTKHIWRSMMSKH